MSRDILFRGYSKAFNNFIYGDLIHSSEQIFNISIPSHRKYLIKLSGDYGSWSVIPETVGQYIGIDDKSGFKIFEGDKCRHYINDDFDIVEEGIVEYLDSRYILRTDDKSYTEFMFIKSEDIEIIGNIYEIK